MCVLYLGAGKEEVLKPQSQWWAVTFVIVFCYSYNQRVFAVYRCMRRRSTERFAVAVRRANLSVTLLYIAFGITGYLTMARLNIDLDNFNYFLDDRGVNIYLFNIAR